MFTGWSATKTRPFGAKAMSAGAEIGFGTLIVSLTAAHPGIQFPAGELNRTWNLHTLTLMELAGMVRLHWSPPVEIQNSATEGEISEYFELHFHRLEVELLQGVEVAGA